MQPATALSFDQDDAETVLVDVRLIEIERTNVGRIRAYAAVEIEIAGIVLGLSQTLG